MDTEKSGRYTFGTSDIAAERLQTIAQFFNPPAVQFIERFIKTPIHTALDLGCGPGYTTHMLSTATNAFNTYGFDKSEQFVNLAKEKYPDCNFILHDVTKFPFPVKAEVLYCRFLLSHLPDAIGLINKWVDELLPGGILFVDELENIHSNIEVFNKYLKISDGLVASENTSLYVGKILSAGNFKAKVLTNEYIYLPVNNALAAEWFYPNTISIWEEEPFVQSSTTLGERKQISYEILRLKKSHDQKSDITWKMRRLAIRK